MGKKTGRKKQNQTMPREIKGASQEPSHGFGSYGRKRTPFQRVRDAFRRFFYYPREEPVDQQDFDDPREQNKTHDRAEDRAAKRLATKMHDQTPLMIEELVNGRISALENRLGGLERSHEEVLIRVDDLWNAFFMRDPPNPLPPESRRSSPLSQPTRTAPKENRNALSSGSVKIDAVEKVVCGILSEESSIGIEIDSLLSEIRRELGEVAISGESIGQRSKISMVWLTATGEGLALVDPGGLADAEVTKFFDVEFGRRVFRCLHPARVIRDGTELAVLRKGKVERL